MDTHISRWLFTTFFICVYLLSIAQYNITAIQKIEQIDADLGVRFQVVINPMVEDSLGFIWIGSKKGLCRYSGSSLKCFRSIEKDTSSIRSNNIENLFIDSDQHIWVAMEGKGIDVFTIKGEKIREFTHDPNNPKSIAANRVWGIFEDNDGYIWVSYFSGGLSRYTKEKKEFEHFSIDSEEFLKRERPKTVVKVVPHSSEPHTFWLSTTRGLVKFNTRTQAYEHFMFTSKIPKGLTESTFNDDVLRSVWNRDMIMDDEGILWLSNFGGIVRFDPKDNSYTVLFYNDGEFTKNGVGLFELDSEKILASVNTGLVFIDRETLKVTTLKEKEGYGPKYYLNVRFFESQMGCLYMISAADKGTGIHKVCTESQYVENKHLAVFQESVLASENYVHYFQGRGEITSIHSTTGAKKSQYLGNEKISVIKYMYDLGGDTILIATVNELFKYHPNGYFEMVDPLVIDNTYRFESLLVDGSGDIWTGRQRDGIYKYDVSRKEVVHYNQNSNPRLVYQDYIRSMMEDSDGDVWISTEMGWTIYNKINNTMTNYLSDDIASKYGIELKSIVDIVEAPNGNFYIADYSYGVLVWNKKTASLIHVIGKEEGLKSGEILDLNVDGDLIWVCERSGLSVIDTKTDKARNFGKEFGISEMTTFSSSDENGNLLVSHTNGLYTIQKRGLLSAEERTPEPIFTEFKLYETPLDSFVFSDQDIILSHNENFFTFGFGSINYHNPWEETYQYQLVGIDKNWIDAKGRRTKGYTNIQPGRYRFNVRVRTNGNWSIPITKQIEIHPAWYHTWWFYTIVVAMALGIIGALLNNYIQSKRKDLEYEKRFAQLETMILKSQMNPHFIFNSLNSIRYLFMVDKKEQGLKYITKFAKLLRTTLHHGEHALINLLDEIELTELFVQLEQLRFDDEFTFTTDYSQNENWKSVQIPPFVIQPIVENAFWHGLSQSEKNEKSIKISIEKEGNSWWVHVEDNGVGMSTSKESIDKEVNKKKSYGLKIIRERFSLMNKTEKNDYQLFIEDAKDHSSGTRVSIKISLT
ncbi:MAG: histidine kinase [Saprospiraceae bacterium]|nr:histidine kinase [Saprospiraceae bacterium]